uniref:Uncharacterized protein n=1 Tax=Myripristis murdjan TaxID=586833 RepID=A0A668AVF2_9TELE
MEGQKQICISLIGVHLKKKKKKDYPHGSGTQCTVSLMSGAQNCRSVSTCGECYSLQLAGEIIPHPHQDKQAPWHDSCFMFHVQSSTKSPSHTLATNMQLSLYAEEMCEHHLLSKQAGGGLFTSFKSENSGKHLSGLR